MRKTSKIILWLVLVIIFLGAGGAAAYFYTKYRQVVKNPEIITKAEKDWLIEKVSRLMSLPQGEEPSIATVLDRDKLKDQPFFKDAENGDKILIYTKAQKAILYRPSADKIIEVMPIVIDKKEAAQNIKIALYNGTETVGLAGVTETKIKDIQDIEVVKKDNANKTTYTKTIVIDLSGTNTSKAKEIADVLGGEVGSLPVGEEKPDVDIVVIIAE